MKVTRNYFFLLFILNSYLLSLEKASGTVVDQFLNAEAIYFQQICKVEGKNDSCRVSFEISELTKLIENRIKNNIDLNLEIRTHINYPRILLCLTSCSDRLLSITQMLLKHNANPNIKNRGKSCLFIAIKNKAKKTVNELLEAGADPNDIVYGRLFRRKTLVAMTPLLLASVQADSRIVRMLLKYGAQPKFCINKENYDFDGCTLLHLISLCIENTDRKVSLGKYLKCAKCLLQYGADPNVCNKHERTPLFTMTTGNPSKRFMKLLLLWGANLTFKDKNGFNATEHAQFWNQPRIVSFLQDWQEGKIKLKKKKIR